MGEHRRYLVALRRGAALGLALTALWGVGLTVDMVPLADRLTTLAEEPSLAVVLLSGQMGDPRPQKAVALKGWGRLLLDCSPLLAAGEELAAARREARQEGGQAPIPDSPVEGEEDQTEPELRPQTDGEGIVEMTARGSQEGKYLYNKGVYLYNRTDLELDASVLEQGTVDVPLGEGPQILIVHTHGSEAYSQSDGDRYEESDPYRTTDCTHNVVRVGEEMAMVFRAHGFGVVHDPTLFDYPSYNGAYDRSRAAVEQWLKDYPTIRIVLDVHRDALVGKDGEVYKLVSEEAGHKVAQLMMVLGSDGGGAEHPRWRDNLAFARTLQQGLTRGYADLARPIVLRNGRYNQQLSPGSLLVEVGGHGNTLTEAMEGARLWADNVARTLLEMKSKL